MTTPGETLLESYINRDQLAEELSCSKRTVDRWHALRIGPPRTVIGRQILYRRDAVEAWLRSLEQAPVRKPGCQR